MNTNTRVQAPYSRDRHSDGQPSFSYPLALSLIFHVVFLAAFVLTPGLRLERPPAQSSVINVSMVSFKNTATQATATPAVDNKAPAVEKPAEIKQPPVKPPVEKTVKVEDKIPPKPKTSLKKQTFKSTEVVKHAIKQLEAKADDKSDPQKDVAASPEMLKSALDRLRQEVGKVEASKSSSTDKGASGESGKTGGKFGTFNEDGKKTAEMIDLYRLEIAFQIQKNWAFNEQLAGGDQTLAAAIVFKVMPDGEIRDIFFTDRSGNAYLDESAYKAIVKSNPVDGHPQGLNQSSVVMAIRFTPQGIR